jgi:hypothetical protein
MSSEDEEIEARLFANLRALQQRNASRPDPPPLRIHHIMACTAVTAVLLTTLRFFVSISPQQQTLARYGIFAFSYVLTAIGLTLTGFSIYWWRKGYAAFSQPGQMLLVPFAGTLVLSLASLALAAAMTGYRGAGRPPSWLSFLPMLISFNGLLFGVLFPSAFYGWCAWKIADTWPWRGLFVLCALAAILISSLMVVLPFVMSIGPGNIPLFIGVPQLARGSLLLTAGALAVVTDLTARRKRSWTHWAGVILWLLGQAGTFVSGVYYVFFWQIV